MPVTRREVLASTAAASLAAPALAKPKRSGAPRVAVIGAGAFGAWTALHLVRSGASVLLIDTHGAEYANDLDSLIS